MKRIRQNLKFSAATRKKLAAVYAGIATGTPRSYNCGICFSTMNPLAKAGLVEIDGYGLTERLFECVTGNRADHMPLNVFPRKATWGVRRKWCHAFAESFLTGVLLIDEEMEASLRLPVRTTKGWGRV